MGPLSVLRLRETAMSLLHAPHTINSSMQTLATSVSPTRRSRTPKISAVRNNKKLDTQTHILLMSEFTLNDESVTLFVYVIFVSKGSCRAAFSIDWSN